MEAACAEKQSRKDDRCPDLNEIVDQKTNLEFPDKIVAI